MSGAAKHYPHCVYLLSFFWMLLLTPFFERKILMERVRESKKQIPTFYIYPLLLTALSAVFICSLRFSLAPLRIKLRRF